MRNVLNNKASKAVVGTNKKTGEIIEFPSAMEAKRGGFNNVNISNCCNNNRNSCMGYTWAFKDEQV